MSTKNSVKEFVTSYEQLVNKWERVQYESFKSWVNINLSTIKKKIETLEGDFQNGVNLSQLVEILSKKKISGISPNPKFQMQKMSNITLSLELLKKEGVRLENIGTADIYDSNLKLIMGMIWILILHYQINTMELQLNLEEEENKKNLSAKEKLLLYCQNLTKGYPVDVNNLTTSFSNGAVLACMIHAKKPKVVNPRKIISSEDKPLNVKECMEILEKEFEVPHVISPESVAEEPDEKAMMTFLSYAIQGLEKFPTVAFGLDDEGEEEVLEEPVKVEATIINPTLDIIPVRVYNLGRGDNQSNTSYSYKSNGEWKPVTWKKFSEEVLDLSKALVSEGIKKGDKVAIFGRSSPSWSTFYLGAQTIGAVPVGIYETSSASVAKYIIEQSESTIVCVFGEVELNKILQVRSSLPLLKRIIIFLESGETGSDGNTILSWNQFLDLGKSVDERNVLELLVQVEEGDEAVNIYTPGTTGQSKAVVLNHRNLQIATNEAVKLYKLTSESKSLSYLPLSQFEEQFFTILAPSVTGSSVFYFEGPSQTFENLKEVQPSVFFATPKVWKKLYITLSTKYPSSQVESLKGEEKEKILSQVGLSKANISVTGASPIDLGTLKYFSLLGREIYELYGQSEDTGLTSLNYDGAFKLGSVGKPLLGLEVKIAEDGEILVKGPTVFSSYLKDPKQTEITLKDGWLHSGDLGRFDNEGYLYITGRKIDVITLENGKKVTPVNIELALKKHSFIGEAVVCGEKRKYLTSLLSPDTEEINQYCKEKNIDPNVFVKSPEFKNAIRDHVNLVNKELGQEEKVKKYTILPVSFSIDGGELTPTYKLKRAFVNQKYAKEIESMYSSVIPAFPSTLGNFIKRAEDSEDKDAYYVKRGGKWEPVTWGQYFNNVKNASRSLIANGVEPHQRVLIVSRSFPNNNVIYLATQFSGAVPVVLSPNTRVEDIAHVSNDTQANIAFVEGKKEFERIEKNRKSFPTLKKIVLLNDGENEKGAESWENFLKDGEKVEESSVDSRVLGIKPEDNATLVYKRLGTPQSKGVLISHPSLVQNARKLSELTGSNEDSKYLSSNPLSNLGEQYFVVHIPVASGSKVYFQDPKESETENRKEVQPTLVYLPSKKWNKLSGKLQKDFPHHKAKESKKEEKEKERENFGLKNVSLAISNDGPLSHHDEKYFDDIDCPVLPLYEELESAGPITFSSKDSRKHGTSGKPVEGNNVEIVGDKDQHGNGELVVAKPGLFSGYNNQPKSFDEKVNGGKLKTGTVGRLDKDGFLIVGGPKDEQFTLEDGTVVNPRDIERELREHPFVDDAVVFGNGRKRVIALLTPDNSEIERAAKENNSNLNDFVQSPKFKEIVKKHVEDVNERFPEKERVKKYKMLNSPFSLDNNEVNAEDELNRDQIGKNNADLLGKLFPRHFGHFGDLKCCPFCYSTPVHWKNILEADGNDISNLSEEEVKQLQKEKLRNTMNILDNWRREVANELGENFESFNANIEINNNK